MNSFSVKQGQQVRSLSWVLWPPASLSLYKKEGAAHVQLRQGHGLFVYHACVMSSQCVWLKMERCVYVWVSRGRRGQTRPQKGAWDPGWRDRGRDGEKKEEEQKMEAWMERWRMGLEGDWVKAKTGSHLCQLGWRDHSPVTCWHISLFFDCRARNSPFTHTVEGKQTADWMNAQGKGTGSNCLNEIHAVFSDYLIFKPWVECTRTSENLNQLSIRTCSKLLLFCWRWGSKMAHNIFL